MTTHLVADVLDEQVVDKDFKNAGRVDGIVLHWRAGERPVVAAIEVSPITLLARFHHGLARWYATLDAKLGAGRGVPYRVSWNRLRYQERAFRMDVDTEATPINALENYLRVHVIERVLGK